MKTVKNPLRLISYIGIVLLSFIFISSYIKSTSTKVVRTNSFIIPRPTKIVLYNSGKVKSLDSKNKNFDETLSLISERIGDTKSFIVEKVSDSLDNYTYNEKKSFRCIQLLYDEDTTIILPSNDDKKLELKFNKLHFLIATDGDQKYGIDIVYGDDKDTHILKEGTVNKDVMCKLLRIINNEII